MTENNRTEKERKPGALAKGLSHILFVLSLLLLFFTYQTYSNAGSFALIFYIPFVPVFLLFLIIGGIAASKLSDFTTAFYYENVTLAVASILGILLLAVFMQSSTNIFQPGSLGLEAAWELFLMLVIPCGIGFAISRSFYSKMGKPAQNEPKPLQ